MNTPSPWSCHHPPESPWPPSHAASRQNEHERGLRWKEVPQRSGHLLPLNTLQKSTWTPTKIDHTSIWSDAHEKLYIDDPKGKSKPIKNYFQQQDHQSLSFYRQLYFRLGGTFGSRKGLRARCASTAVRWHWEFDIHCSSPGIYPLRENGNLFCK